MLIYLFPSVEILTVVHIFLNYIVENLNVASLSWLSPEQIRCPEYLNEV